MSSPSRQASISSGWRQASNVTGTLSFHLEVGDRVDVSCNSNQPPLDTWHVLTVWFIFLHVALDQVGSIIPPIRVFVREYLIIVTGIVAIFGFARMLLDFRRRHALKSVGPVIWLEIITAGWSPGCPAERV